MGCEGIESYDYVEGSGFCATPDSGVEGGTSRKEAIHVLSSDNTIWVMEIGIR